MADKLEMKTKSISQENIEKIRALFPNAVTEIIKDGKVMLAVDFDVLKQELSECLIAEGQERYQMTWPDKKKSVVLANSAIAAALRPCREESVDFDTTQNLYIEGDNLDVLKLLRETYLGKVKMIYIDPPYNTGNDFIYEDDFAQDSDEYLGNSGQYDEQGNRLVKNLDSNGRFHTDWLNMIYPRLKVAKDLLADDGVICISINEYEYKNLSKLCEELFSAQNHVCTFTWETKKAAQGMTTANMVVDNHDLVYVLDALDAFNKKLVKKIQVKGFTVKNLLGTNGYLYLQDIILSPSKPPTARIEMEIRYKSGKTNRETRLIKVGDNLYQMSNEMEQYRNGFVVSEINPFDNTVTFINGNVLELGKAAGEVSEMDVRRIQIRETIRSHFEKEEELYERGIKVLSLFFIDEVAKYRRYDENGEEINGVYGDIFEEEYNKVLNDYITLFDTPYVKYLKSTSAQKAHNGYFSIDKKGRKVDSSTVRGSDISDDVSAYDLILKDKERLLSFDEPTRFIFSHSALREGWDNPNVFQICTLKHSSSNVQRRQEVGRGLRLCVNSSGERMDATIPNFDVHALNMLTVVANDSYEDFVKGLQTEIKENLYERPSRASKEFFAGKKIVVEGEERIITAQQATAIYRYLLKNDYIDDSDKPTDTYKNDVTNGTLAPMPFEIEPMAEVVHKLVQSVYDADALSGMVEDGHQSKVQDNKLNANFGKKEFQNLWNLINHKYAYTVAFDSEELIKNAVKSIDDNLYVTTLTYTVSTGEQKDEIDSDEIKNGVSFKTAKTRTESIRTAASDTIKYDLLGKIASQTSLTRRTVAVILKSIRPDKFACYKANPEDFINKVVALINEQKASLIVEHVTYNQIDGSFDSTIFAESKATSEYRRAYKATKHIRDYVFVDGVNQDASIERRFAEDLDNAEEVCVYAKLPKAFYIPTPVGNYSPDWAIAFNEGTVRHIYFLAETKGSLNHLQIRPIENAKIECAKKLFNKMSSSKVRYENVTSYKDLLDKMNGLA